MKQKWIWGLLFILAAFAIVINQMDIGIIKGLNAGLSGVLMSLALLPVIVYSLMRLNFFGIFLPLSIILLIFAKDLGFESLSWWAIIVAGILMGAGCKVLFAGRRKRAKKDSFSCHSRGWINFDGNETVESSGEDAADCNVTFGAATRYFHSEDIKRVSLRCSFGAIKAYFDNSKLHPDGAVLDINCSFGDIKLFIPKTWKIDDQVSSTLAELDYKNHPLPDDKSPVLRLTGNICFSEVEITYV